jgi:hypothetical protein
MVLNVAVKEGTFAFSINYHMSYCNPHTQSEELFLALFLSFWNLQNIELTCEDSVKLLGIEIDYQLNFDTHISTICRKASQQQFKCFFCHTLMF